jgi:hypothetical protein
MPTITFGLDPNQEAVSAKHREPAVGWSDVMPMAGNWLAGDILYRPTPAAGTATGFICIEAGSPGLWTTLPETVTVV